MTTQITSNETQSENIFQQTRKLAKKFVSMVPSFNVLKINELNLSHLRAFQQQFNELQASTENIRNNPNADDFDGTNLAIIDGNCKKYNKQIDGILRKTFLFSYVPNNSLLLITSGTRKAYTGRILTAHSSQSTFEETITYTLSEPDWSKWFMLTNNKVISEGHRQDEDHLPSDAIIHVIEDGRTDITETWHDYNFRQITLALRNRLPNVIATMVMDYFNNEVSPISIGTVQF